MRSEIASVVTHFSGYGNVIVDGREKNPWLKSIIDHYCQGFSEQVVGANPTPVISAQQRRSSGTVRK